ncbi:aldehyde dehydrogenase [Boeremia exigua]|uniref:aldehyde dehydrogenase n=1 Tax=Boeremia exigua TaxID=749465 RepID=UPI001E8E31E5|nr:aldehyde dehydrogenase [Boeremia exigua]KAH6632912.1 aldehyde dehydrogenase [Boeremia exigua]
MKLQHLNKADDPTGIIRPPCHSNIFPTTPSLLQFTEPTQNNEQDMSAMQKQAWSKEEIETRLFINGNFVKASGGETFELKSPSTMDVVAEVAEASVEDTNAAVAAAKAAQPSWAALSPEQRGAYMKKLAGLIREAHTELAYLEAISMGRPVRTYWDSWVAASNFEHFAEAGYLVQGTSSLNTPGYVNVSLKQPFGVVAAIIPWNLPIFFLSSKLAPALAAGNTVVLKSSEKAPLTSAKVATLIERAGFPPGVINVLSGHGHISGSCLSSHIDVRALSFTGSTRTGRMIQIAAAQSNLKNVMLELGGKSPAIVFDDSDIDLAAAETKNSIQWNSGQSCMANSRIYVQDTVADRFISVFKKNFEAITIGDPTNNATDHGPMADEVQFKIVRSYIDSGRQSGELVTGGGSPDGAQGFVIQPTIFKNVPEDAKILKEEIFGPVVIINTFSTEEEIMKKANETEYGLYAAVYTKSLDRAMRFAKGLEAGTVAINCTSPTVAHDMPFGGWKTSGVGREGYTSSINNFLETKTVLMKIST